MVLRFAGKAGLPGSEAAARPQLDGAEHGGGPRRPGRRDGHGRHRGAQGDPFQRGCSSSKYAVLLGFCGMALVTGDHSFDWAWLNR
ncbi:hypothetical protein LV779_12865 [Streptomyces thinghirensis]|nr:hypothetical protein [Streptomyces thinghirensis]